RYLRTSFLDTRRNQRAAADGRKRWTGGGNLVRARGGLPDPPWRLLEHAAPERRTASLQSSLWRVDRLLPEGRCRNAGDVANRGRARTVGGAILQYRRLAIAGFAEDAHHSRLGSQGGHAVQPGWHAPVRLEPAPHAAGGSL